MLVVRPELVQKALATIGKRQADYEYFFSRLNSPDWILPLKEAGMFSVPPEPEREGEYISFPRWPESEYLARMASRAPETVIDVIIHMRTTENIRVNEDLIDAALSMPAEFAVKVAQRARVWAKSKYTPLFPEKLGTFIAHLARGGYSDEALDLAKTVLKVLPDPDKERYLDDNPYRLSPQPRTRYGSWDYKIIVKAIIPDLVEAGGIDSFKLFCEVLDDAIKLSRNRSDDPGPEDYSYIWRPDIDSSLGHDDVKDIAVSAVRRAGEELLKSRPELIPVVVNELEGRAWRIFHRVALYFLHVFPEEGKLLIKERLTNKSLFGVLGLWHEFFELAQLHFAELDEKEQRVFLEWVSEGPPSGTVEDEKEGRFWRFRRLAPVSEVLPDEYRKLYEHLETEFGKIEWPQYVSPPVTMHFGYDSPKDAQELQQMSFEEIISFLKGWQSTDKMHRQTPEGLGQQLTAAVAADPVRFADEVEQLKQLDPTYVRAVLSGLRAALQQIGATAWPAVLKLCKWVIDQPTELASARGRITEEDPDWTWTKGSIESLIEDGLTTEKAIPFSLRQEVWSVLAPLTEDSHPTSASETGSNMDPFTLSLNTLRGQAMHCVMHYALWCKRHLESGDELSTQYAGFESIPEVREVLDSHLDPAHDPSLSVRAVYGKWLPWLVQVDAKWTVANLEKILPKDEELRSFLDAAWNTYVVYNHPYNEVFNALRQEYRAAVERIGTVPSEKQSGRDPEDRLTEHLMMLYGRGKLTFEDEDNLLSRFYEVAPGDVRGHAIWFFGRDLIDMKETIPSDVMERLKNLWLRRIEEARSTESKAAYVSELSFFGGWFASGKFDDFWALTQLRDALQVSGSAQPYHSVLERLAEVAPIFPDLAVECLMLLIEGDKKRQYTYVWHEHLRTVLIAALKSADKIARQSAETLINKLLARDRAYGGFRELLKIVS